MVSMSLLELSPILDAREMREAVVPLRKFAKHSSHLVNSLLKGLEFNVNERPHGRRLALLSRVLPRRSGAEAWWTVVQDTTVAALREKVWSPTDLKGIVYSIRQNGAYNDEFLLAVAAYVEMSLPGAPADHLPALVSMITAFPESMGNAKLLNLAGDCCVPCMGTLTSGAIGHICGQFNRVLFSHRRFAVAVQEEASRCAENGDLFTAVQLFCFVTRHDAELINVDALVWLAERITGEDLDVPAIGAVSSALGQLPMKVRWTIRQELADLIVFVATQVLDLLTVPVERGGLKGERDTEVVQLFVSRFLQLSEVLMSTTGSGSSSEVQLPQELTTALNACAEFIEPMKESLLSSESSPFGLMIRLIETPTQQAREVGISMLREASHQHMFFPAVQTFRFLLLMGDHELKERTSLLYLRNQFAKTAANIPSVQLSVALKCLCRCLDRTAAVPLEPDNASWSAEQLVTAELEKEDQNAFFRFCTETARKYLSDGVPLRCILSIVEGLYSLGCRDVVFYEEVAHYIDLKRSTVDATGQSTDAASVVSIAFGPVILGRYPGVDSFLEEVQKAGVAGESALRPTDWMNLHDPANNIAPLTLEQQETWNLIEKMVQTRADDTVTLVKLAEEYLRLIKNARPDDHKYFFGVFEEKVLKEDKLLKACLDTIVEANIIHYFAPQTIGSVLQSLAAIRFKYVASVKRFLGSVTEEQWGGMEAAPLVQILSGMAKLSLRTPLLLKRVERRLTDFCCLLRPIDTAEAVRCLQALGCCNAALIAQLMQHAAASAYRFDEVSMGLLFSTPSIHRLVSTPEIAQPLLLQASAKIHSVVKREQIARWVRRSSLPRDLIEAATARLQVSDGLSKTEEPLRLA